MADGKEPMEAISEYVGPTPERLARAGEDVEAFIAENNRPTLRMLDGSPLERLATRRKITGDQYHAGCRYFADAYGGGLLASGVIDLSAERVDCQTAPELTDHRLAAQTRFAHAHKALDRDKAHVLSDVVLSEMPISVYADRFREFLQKRERLAVALNLLRAALTQLDLHYNPPRRTTMQTAHQPDYRGTI